MKTLCWMAVLLAFPMAGCGMPDDDEKAAQDLNVNSRYTIESVHVSGQHRVNIGNLLQSELDKVIGSKYDDSTVKRLADRIKRELRVSDVAVNVVRGTEPGHVIVNFELTGSIEQPFDLTVRKFLYDSKDGFTGDGSATMNLQGNAFTFGLISDNDSLVERFAGMRLKYERKSLGTKRLQFRFEFDDYHEQWNAATLALASSDELYRTRQEFTPEGTLILAQPLEWSFGVSFDRLGLPLQNGAAAAKTESSNAVVNTLRYHQRWGSEHDQKQQELTGMYSIRAASNLLDTDMVFTRQESYARYKYRRGRQGVELGFLAGVINGNAPLFERFVLGDSETLRGWNRFDLDPLGGSHVVHGSADYHYRVFEVFYDTGAVWDRPQDRDPKQSVGVGFKKEALQLAVAFPVRVGRVDPIFYAGMSF
jgi:outer membrane protein assembly factor BamA